MSDYGYGILKIVYAGFDTHGRDRLNLRLKGGHNTYTYTVPTNLLTMFFVRFGVGSCRRLQGKEVEAFFLDDKVEEIMPVSNPQI